MKTALTLTLVWYLSLSMTNVPAADKSRPANPNAAWTDPQKAALEDPDFLIQGEYGVAAAGQSWGVQVVALGAGRFDAYLLEGGLPGLGWDRTKKRIQLTGSRQGEEVTLANSEVGFAANLVKGQLTVRQDGDVVCRLARVERHSSTLEAKPPPGAIVLFNGSSADAWINGRVENGLLPNTEVSTKRKFQDFSLHLEFRTPYKPYARGQARGNSGVYYQGRFETQVLDSFGLTGEMNECGGIYSIARPRLNMCLPPLTWQTYDVDFTAAQFDPDGKLLKPARITVRLNGVLIHENQELPHTTTAAPNRTITPEPGPIYIQRHGNPVYYRNIWIVPR